MTKEERKEYNKKYYLEHKNEMKEYFQNYRDEHREHYKEYYLEHKEEKKEYYKQYRDEHRNYYREYNKKYSEFKIKTDIEFKIKKGLRNKLNFLLKRGIGKSKDLVGCSCEELKKYIEGKFKDGMTWDNYGKQGWEIDHIRPCCSFDLTKIEQQKECFHYTNLQPLWVWENASKGRKYNKEEEKQNE